MNHCNVPETHDYSVPKLSFNYINRTGIIRGHFRQHSKFHHHFLQPTSHAILSSSSWKLPTFSLFFLVTMLKMKLKMKENQTCVCWGIRIEED